MDSAPVNIDDLHLEKMGYKQVLHRGLSPLMNFAFGFTEVAVLSSICVTFGYGLGTGGPATLFWTFLTNFGVTIFIGYSMAELCAAYPSAGSVYHWAAQVSSKEWAPILSYITGWSNWAGNTAGDASFAVGWASFLSASIAASGGEPMEPRPQVGVSIAVLTVCTFLNFFRVDQVGWINNLAAIAHVSALIIIVVAVLSLTPRLSTAEWVFKDYYSNTGFTDHSYVGAVGITSALFAFVGYEASAHMAEETGDATSAASKGLIKTIYATGFGGVLLILALLFASQDYLEQIVNDDDYYGGPATGDDTRPMIIHDSFKSISTTIICISQATLL
jgi:amino acid transporter